MSGAVQPDRHSRLALVPADEVSTAQVVSLVLSRIIGATTARGLSRANACCRVLAFYGTTTIVKGGEQLPPPFPGLPLGPWPTGVTAGKRLGLSSRELRDTFQALLYERGSLACYSSDVLAAFFPQPLQRVMAVMLRDGPGVAAERGARAVFRFSQQPVAATRRRPAGPPLAGTVSNFRGMLQRMFAIFVELRVAGVNEIWLDRWEAVPKVPVPHVPPSNLNNDGPRLQLVRAKIRALDEEIWQRLGVNSRDEELQAIRTMSPTAIRRAAAHRPLRLRLLLILLTALGARIGEIAALRRRDFVPSRIGPAPDRRTGPALIIYPGKKRADVQSPKPIPPEMAELLLGYMLYTDRLWAVDAGLGFRVRPLLAAEDRPLLVAHVRTGAPWGEHGIRIALAGHFPTRSNPGRRALIPREAGINEEIPPARRAFVGYHPHAYRHTASQMAEASGRWWHETHPEAASAPLDPTLYAAALLDHSPHGAGLQALYGDRLGPQFVELLAGRAIDGNWQQLCGDLGAQKMPDVEHWREVMKLKIATERQLASKGGSLRQLLDQECAPSESPSNRDLRDALFQVSRLEHDMTVLREQLVKLDQLLAQLREDRGCWCVLPDDEAPPPWPEFETLERQLRSLEPVEPDGPPVAPERVRDWLTVVEFADCFSLDRATAFRWCVGDSLPVDARRRPWEVGAAPVDVSLGIRYRRIAVDYLNADFWRGERVRDRVAKVLAVWPEKKGWKVRGEPGPRCFAALVLPTSVKRS